MKKQMKVRWASGSLLQMVPNNRPTQSSRSSVLNDTSDNTKTDEVSGGIGKVTAEEGFNALEVQ